MYIHEQECDTEKVFQWSKCFTKSAFYHWLLYIFYTTPMYAIQIILHIFSSPLTFHHPHSQQACPYLLLPHYPYPFQNCILCSIFSLKYNIQLYRGRQRPVINGPWTNIVNILIVLFWMLGKKKKRYCTRFLWKVWQQDECCTVYVHVGMLTLCTIYFIEL